MNCTIERGAKQSANVQWHHTKNKRQPLEATEQKKSVVGVSVCAIFRAIDTMTRHRQWTCDDLTSNDIHTHTQHVQPFKQTEKRKDEQTLFRTHRNFSLSLMSICCWPSNNSNNKNMKN